MKRVSRRQFLRLVGRFPPTAVVALLLARCGRNGEGTPVAGPAHSPTGDGFGEGSISVLPASVFADSLQNLRFQYSVGPSGIAPGGGIKLRFPVRADLTASLLWDACQTKSSDLPGFVEASLMSRTGAGLDIRCGKAGALQLALQGGALSPGDRIDFTYKGNVQALARSLALRVHSRHAGEDPWRPLSTQPRIEILSLDAAVLLVVAPADVERDAACPLSVVAFDRFGNRAQGYRGTIQFNCTDSEAEVPAPYTFTQEDAGVHAFPAVVYRNPGSHRISVTDGDSTFNGNYSRVWQEAELRYGRYFGDTHFHTGTGAGNVDRVEGAEGMLGDHRGNYTTEQEAYAYARDVMRLDFASASEHDGDAFTEDLWRMSQDITQSSYEPGAFTTFFAYEWTSSLAGHRVVMYRDYGGKICHWVDPRYDTPDELWAALDQQGTPFLCIPHVMWERTEDFEIHPLWTQINNECQRVGEICSHHNVGDSQRFEVGLDDTWSYQHAWHLGHRIGLIGSSDNHLGTPGVNDFTHYVGQAGGLAVILAERNDRESLWDALWNRRTYATTGTRIYLDFQIDGHHMGEEFVSDSSPRISATVAGTARLATVELIKHDHAGYAVIHTAQLEGDLCSFELVDEDFGTDSFYYVRVTQVDAEMAWSSPIWVDRQDP